MRSSIISCIFFSLGIFIGLTQVTIDLINRSQITDFALYCLVFFVGISVGIDPKVWHKLRNLNYKVFLVPIFTIIGTLIGGAVSSFIIDGYSLKDGLLISSGFGFYSLSSVMISKHHSETIGVVALISNLLREIITLVFTPLIAKYFGKLAPIACGGAIAMDTGLPVIINTIGKHFVVTSVLSGLTISILVPILITIILNYA